MKSMAALGDHGDPDLVQSITEDDDDDDEDKYPQSSLVMPNEEVVDRQAIAYLLRYETMVRQQEAEDMATVAHIKPLLTRLEALSESYPLEHTSSVVPDLQRRISYLQLQQALDTMLDQSHHDNHDNRRSEECMTTDRQLMMVLQTLTQKQTAMDTMEEQLTYAEFIQCYKVVVAGMQTLQHLQGCDARSRARDRTLSIISLFEAPSTKLLHDADDGIPKQIQALETNPHAGGGILSRLSSTPKVTKRQQTSALTVICLAALTIGIIGSTFAGIVSFRPDIVHEWKMVAVEHLMTSLELSRCVNTPMPTTEVFSTPNAPSKPAREARDMNMNINVVPTLEIMSQEQASTKTVAHTLTQPTKNTTPDTQGTIEAPRTKEVFLQRLTQQNWHTSAAMGGAVGMAVAPFLLRAVPWIGKAIVNTVQSGGLGAWGIFLMGSSVMIQVVVKGIGPLLHQHENRNK